MYDWRAPVSGLFMILIRGQQSMKLHLGQLRVRLCQSGGYKIRNGRMIYGFESDVKIDDEILKQELGSNGDVHVNIFVRTIQKEQNAIIRKSQKTRFSSFREQQEIEKNFVAFHRIAYLLYHDREHLKSSNILILFSEQCVCRLYLAHSAELGEENIQEMSLICLHIKNLSMGL